MTAGPASDELEQQWGAPYRRIFASYSLEDLDVVRQVASYASIFGDTFVHEASELHGAGTWDDRLAGLIRDADLFQLFWSSRAMHEPVVRREWTYALSLQRAGFVRPVYWEEPLPSQPEANLPPPELSELSFQRLPVQVATVNAAPVPETLVPPVAGPPSMAPGAPVPVAPAPPSGVPRKNASGRLLSWVGGGVMALALLAVGVTALTRSSQPSSPTAGAPSTAAPTQPAPGSAPGVEPVTALLPAKVAPESCQAPAGELTPFAGAAGVTAELSCGDLPNLPGGQLVAVSFADQGAYAAGLVAFNADIGFDPAVASDACPPAGGATGSQSWSRAGTVAGPGQIVECSVPATGPGAGRALYLWTFPASHAFLVVTAGPDTSLSELGAWWMRNVVEA